MVLKLTVDILLASMVPVSLDDRQEHGSIV